MPSRDLAYALYLRPISDSAWKTRSIRENYSILNGKLENP